MVEGEFRCLMGADAIGQILLNLTLFFSKSIEVGVVDVWLQMHKSMGQLSFELPHALCYSIVSKR